MSTDYKLGQRIRVDDLFDGRLQIYGITEHVKDGCVSPGGRCLSDGRNYLWVYGSEYIECITRFGGNAPGKILDAVAEVFETEIFSEYEPQYWGFDTQEEWDLEMQKINDKAEAEFHANLIKHVNGEPNDLRPGTIGMIQAEIAKDLVTANPALLGPESKYLLMQEIRDIYTTEHGHIVNLTDEDIALVELMATHEDDMSSA